MESDLHFLKGSALNLGFSDLASLCQTEERRAAQGATDVPLDRVRDVYLASREVFLRDLARQLAA
jgi:HPt (histidine-containing phosphotransfer) domain-containing protein